LVVAGVRSAVTAALVCLAVTAPAGAVTTTAGPVSYSTAQATIGAGGTDEVAALCPVETSLSGGGAGFTTAPAVTDGVEIAMLYPDDALDGDVLPDERYIAAGAVAPAEGSRKLRTTAICLEASDDPGAVTYEDASGTVGAGNISGGGLVNCSAGEVMGGGFHSTSAIEDVELEELSPSFTDDKLNPSRMGSGYSKTDGAMTYTTFAMCSPENLKHVYDTKVVFAGRHKIKTACPKGSYVVGGGYGRYSTDLIASQPYDSKDKGKAPDDGWQAIIRSGGGVPLAMYAWASCLNS
jgi:hypothetical protein